VDVEADGEVVIGAGDEVAILGSILTIAK
jgi:hypothetical protein